MKYLSLFSGIEAASVAWQDFGWTCVGVSEIDPFPCAVLKERFPTVPNLGDITQITKEKLDEIKEGHETIDIVVGGSPCQSFSVAGARKGLKDPRGNLMFEYCRVVRTVRPSYFIWENVPGALSSGKGADFGALIAEMVDIGYSLCWRVLDAQHFGVPQRRKRVFLVGCLGDNTSGFDILFEREGSKRNLEPSRETREDDTSQVESSIGEHDQEQVTFLESTQSHATMGETSVCSTLTAAMGLGGGHVPMVVDDVVYHSNHRSSPPKEHDKCPTLLAWMGTGGNNIPMMIERGYYEHNQTDARIKGPKDIANTITARYGTGGGHVPFVMETTHENAVYLSSKIRTGGDLELKVCPTLTAQTKSGDTMPLTIEHRSYNITFNDANGTRKDRPHGGCYINETETSNAITTGGVGDTRVIERNQSESKVRRLTPLECERLQGFPDNWTLIEYRGKAKNKCPKSPRYKALGNSMAVPVMRFIGLGILELEKKEHTDET